MVLRPPCAWIDLRLCLREQLLVRCIWCLFVLAEGVVKLQEDATAEPEFHDRVADDEVLVVSIEQFSYVQSRCVPGSG